MTSTLAFLLCGPLFFSTRPSPGLLPVLGPLGGSTDAYTCLAMPCGSRAGADLGRTSGSEVDASPVREREVYRLY